MVHNLLTCLACLFLSALVQEENCKTETLDKGRITVKYCLSEVIDSNGNSSLLIKDSTTTEVCIDFERCIQLLKDVSKHKLFTGDKKSQIIKPLSDNKWIIYYYTNNPWPIKDSDCVSRLVFIEDHYCPVKDSTKPTEVL